MFLAGRLLIGINSGINMGIAPMYLTEIAPVTLRGIFGVLTQLGVVSSILLSQVIIFTPSLGRMLIYKYIVSKPENSHVIISCVL